MKSESEVAQSCLTLSDPMDCSLTGSSIHGIFQARVLEWGAIAFSALSILVFSICQGLPWWLNGKESTCKWILSLSQEDPLEKEVATHSSILAWEISWTEQPGGLQSMGSQKSRTRLSDFLLYG